MPTSLEIAHPSIRQIFVLSRRINDRYRVSWMANIASMQCSRVADGFTLLLNEFLYEMNMRNLRGCATKWAAKNGYEKSAQSVLEARVSPNASVFGEWLPMAF